MCSRFYMVIPVLAIAGSLAKKSSAAIAGHVSGDKPLFTAYISVILYRRRVDLFPALSSADPGAPAENAGKTF